MKKTCRYDIKPGQTVQNPCDCKVGECRQPTLKKNHDPQPIGRVERANYTGDGKPVGDLFPCED